MYDEVGIKACKETILIIPYVCNGCWTYAMGTKPWWQMCHMVEQSGKEDKKAILSASFAKTKILLADM